MSYLVKNQSLFMEQVSKKSWSLLSNVQVWTELALTSKFALQI